MNEQPEIVEVDISDQQAAHKGRLAKLGLSDEFEANEAFQAYLFETMQVLEMESHYARAISLLYTAYECCPDNVLKEIYALQYPENDKARYQLCRHVFKEMLKDDPEFQALSETMDGSLNRFFNANKHLKEDWIRCGGCPAVTVIRK